MQHQASLITLVVILCLPHAHGKVIFQEDFETREQKWHASRYHTTEGSFDQSFETPLAFQGSRVGRLIGSSNDKKGYSSRAISFTTIGAHIPVPRPVMYYSFWMRIPEDTGIGRFSLGHAEVYQGRETHVFPRGVLFDFDSEVDLNNMGFDWYFVGTRARQASFADPRKGWVHIEAAELRARDVGGNYNTTCRYVANAWKDSYSDHESTIPATYEKDTEVSIQIGTEQGSWREEVEVWIDDLVIYDDFLTPDPGSIGMATLEEYGKEGQHQIRLENITWPVSSGSGFTLKLELHVGGIHPRHWHFAYEHHDDPHPSTGYLYPHPIRPPTQDLCELDLSDVSISWAHEHKDEPGMYSWAPAYASEKVAIDLDVYWCK